MQQWAESESVIESEVVQLKYNKGITEWGRGKNKSMWQDLQAGAAKNVIGSGIWWEIIYFQNY